MNSKFQCLICNVKILWRVKKKSTLLYLKWVKGMCRSGCITCKYCVPCMEDFSYTYWVKENASQLENGEIPEVETECYR